MLNFFKNGANIFKEKQANILSAAAVIAISVAISRILGLIRYRLLASNFGDDIKLLDSYIAASVLPDAIFEVLIFGAIALAFIPVFSEHIARDKLEKAWELTSSIISLSLVLFAVFSLLVIVFASQIAPIIAPGLVAKEPSTQQTIANLLRIMIFSQLFFLISIFLTGILQSFQRFLVPAIASIFYNFGIIASIIFLSPLMGIYAPALGMVLGSILHLAVQLPLAKSLGFKYKPTFNFNTGEVREMFHLMWPRSLTLGLARLSDIINIALASIATVGSIVAFNFAQVLQLVPIALFAGSLAQASLPSLSLEFNAKRYDQFKKIFADSFHQIIFLILPAAAIIAILRIPLVRLVFGAREFSWDLTVLTGRTLIAFSIGIPALALSLLLTRGFHAVKDSKTPLIVSGATISLNIAFSLFFVLVLKESIVYLALIYSCAAILNAATLFYFLDKKIGFDNKTLLIPAAKMLAITLITALFLYVPMKLLDQLVFDTTRTMGLIALTSAAVVAGLIVYISLSYVFKVKEVVIFWGLTKKIIAFPSRLTKPAPTSIEAQQPNP